jgi:pectinesterase
MADRSRTQANFGLAPSGGVKTKILTFSLIAVIALLGGCAITDKAAGNTGIELQVRKDCKAAASCYSTIQAAVDIAQQISVQTPVRIRVGAGDFDEKVVIERGNLSLTGQGAKISRLRHNLVAEYARQYHRNRWGTAGSATLTINGDDVKITDITVENSFDYLANDSLAPGDPKKISNSQALAVLLDVASDRVLFDRVAMLGYQDTLFANGRRGYVRNSLIAGNVDFIFGNGQLLIEVSELRTRPRGAAADEGEFDSFIVAPSTQISEPVGIVVHRSRLTREAGVRDNSVALARPWHPTTRFADGRYADPNAIGQAIFIDCFMDAHIHREHWTSMNGTARNGTKSDIFGPQGSRFWETGSHGPGAAAVDIGMSWKPAMGMPEIRAYFARDWPALSKKVGLDNIRWLSAGHPTRLP